MAALQQADLRASLEFVREAESVTRPIAFTPEVLELLRQLVPCDLVNFCELDRQRERVISDTFNTGERFDGDPDDPEVQAFWRLRHEHPVCAHQDRTGDFSARKITDFMSRRQFHQLEIYSVWWCELGRQEFELDVGIPGAPWHTKVFLFHGDDHDFRERDRLILDLLRPHLAHFDRNASMRRLAAALAAGADARGELVVLDAGDAIDFATARARRLLRDYCNDGRGPRLPPLIGDWLSHARRNGDDLSMVAGGSLTIDRADRRLVVTRLNGDKRTLLLTEELVSADGAKQLSWREWQVLGHVDDGKTNAQIAAALCIAPATIRTHLENIYAKLGVHGRTAALARVRGLNGAVSFD
jgi:DNA-binding CsgD family transcriptional regulator